MNSHRRRVKATILAGLHQASNCAQDAATILSANGFDVDALDSIRMAKNRLTECEERFMQIRQSMQDDVEALQQQGGVIFTPTRPMAGQS